MTTFQPLLQHPLAQAIGWALLQFVWQGALVAVLTAVALASLRRGAADVRYVVASIGLALMLTLPVVTAAQRWRVEGARQTTGGVPTVSETPSASPAPVKLPVSVATTTAIRDSRTSATEVAPPSAAPLGWTMPARPMRPDVVAALFTIWVLGVSSSACAF